jgi:hypothetical protein
MIQGAYWFCDALGEAWDMELHDETPCSESRELYGDSPGEHDNCGYVDLTRPT